MALGALLAAAAVAKRADDVLGVCKLGRLAPVQLLEGNLVLLLYRSSFARDVSAARGSGHTAHTREAATHSTEHLSEDIFHAGIAAHAGAARGVEGGHAMRVIKGTLLVIGQDFVGLLGGFEANLGLFALLCGDLVGVVGEGGLVVGLLNLSLSGTAVDAKHLFLCQMEGGAASGHGAVP